MSANDFREHLARYQNDGYVIFRDVLDEELVANARQHVDWLRAEHPHLRPEHLHTLLVYNDPFWVRLVSDPRLLDIAAAFVGDDIALYASHYIAKPPQHGQPVFWHQDGHYWTLEPMRVVSLWLAVTPSVPENGCMRVIPGTHLMQLQKHDQCTNVENVLQSQTAVEEKMAARAVDVVLQPGDVSMHHPNILHGSESNRSDEWRIGLTIRYIPTSTKVLDEEFKVILMQGSAVQGVNKYADWPKHREGMHFLPTTDSRPG